MGYLDPHQIDHSVYHRNYVLAPISWKELHFPYHSEQKTMSWEEEKT